MDQTAGQCGGVQHPPCIHTNPAIQPPSHPATHPPTQPACVKTEGRGSANIKHHHAGTQAAAATSTQARYVHRH
ncbi:hypothetical protein E2C01_069100 [Portunus trituberculatus]|uniref:Uncharacterized protein n=1 Tax=Portunus trituberculatus TaxID=210409 RepID=A0A5B7HYC5_PORTR|nr:hypothetical protein [Portunus trituberculatus]